MTELKTDQTPASLPVGDPAVSARAYSFDLAIPNDARRSLAMAWLMLGLFALVASGLFSVLLVLSRTPQLQQLFPVADFFRVALVVHVDLSVLVWFLAFGGALWSLSSTPRLMPLARTALVLATLGTLAMTLSPFLERATPVMANYIPVLQGPIFMTGLLLFGGGFSLLCLRSMLAATPVGMRVSGDGALRFGLNAAMVATAVAIIAFGWSWTRIPLSLDPRAYYELLFWGGGHVLQFAYTLLMLIGWIWLSSALAGGFRLSPRVVTLLFAITLLAVFLTPITYLAYDPTSVEHHRMQTLLMRYGGGLSIAPVAIAVLWTVLPLRGLSSTARPLQTSVLASLCLFSAGGVIGLLISGSNVRIPAHYHGCIVGVTLAMMGMVFHLLPRLGYPAPRSKAAAWQPLVYGFGQLMHITGLVWSGGYGVQRKVAGAEQVLRSREEIWGMGLMGLGGLVAIVGGVMFLVIVIRSLRGSVPAGGRKKAGVLP
ncbi:MAG: cbb3-type cytochrome c oxidase subunit I [Burkholderiaceae bacterium]|nr:cbb3-type cytochrome c oxidase subunit I [Burkholderiaceae bacterium]